MEKTIQCLHGVESVSFFGVRHLSPACAFHLLCFLEEKKPDYILVEGPSDGNMLIQHISNKQIKPPFALLSYTTTSPVQTVLYPFAEYSPELQAIRWADDNNVPVAFIDLPTSATIRFEKKNMYDENDFYVQAYKLAGEYDYESFWERNFEHCQNTNEFIEAMTDLSDTIRLMEHQADDYYNLLRESYMKRSIVDVINKGFTNVVAVVGAYHTGGIAQGTPMTDHEMVLLPKESIKLTLMPYSYYRLSSQSGYGAGNKAPEYFKLLWRYINAGDLAKVAPAYLAEINTIARNNGNYSSTANVIEGVRLANGLAYMHESCYPTLNDLHDSAVCLLGNGELASVAEAFAHADIGTAIGELPEGLSQTPIQDDMNRIIKKLKLEKFKSVVAQDLMLDLRENRKVKNKEAAFIDLSRSIFFNRLKFLNINFATKQISQNSAWSEKWTLCWTPEAEIQVVEAVLKGETIENAAAFGIKEQLDKAEGILDVCTVIYSAYECNLMSEMPNALRRLQNLCVDAGNFCEISATCFNIANILDFKTIRNVDTDLLLPILEQLLLRGSLVIFDCAGCNNDAAAEIVQALDKLHNVSQRHYEFINDDIWVDNLKKVAFSDNRNAKISGAVTALLLERNLISDADFKIEMSRRLSLGVPGDLAALWFEGLASRNRYALLSQVSIWQHLDEYLEKLDFDEFKRSLVFLRRTFGDFTPKEKNAIIEILADLWHVENAAVSEFLQDELNEEESAQLDALNDFDFNDF